MADTELPRDPYSVRLRELRGHPEAVEKNSRVEVPDFYGNLDTYNVKTISHDGNATLFLEIGTSGNGRRVVLPPQVMAAIYRHRDSISTVRIKRGAKRAAAARKVAGIKPFAKKAVSQ